MTKFSVLSRNWQLKLVGGGAIVGTFLTAAEGSVLAQIVPDTTLGAEGSVVTPNVNINGIPSDRIDGGAIRGSNLFHSFAQFNIGAGRGAYFFNPAGIATILSRVTGATRSDILGRLGVLGTANLFLINPNGIVFGPAASLDVQGSFVAATANAVKLGDTGLFSASQPATSNLLSISPSALWFNAIAAQPIVNRSQAQSSFNQPNSAGLNPGLQVPDGQTLALVGGDVLLEGGRLSAAQGRIELGSVAGVGQVSLTGSGNGLVLGYDSLNEFGNIGLSNGAFVDASGEGGGDIQIRGGRLEMIQGSNIWADTLGADNGGGIWVRAAEVDLSESSLLSASVTDTGTGTGGDLTIDTGRLLVSGGAGVAAMTYGTGKGGNLFVRASESVELSGTSADDKFASGLFTDSEGVGMADNLLIAGRGDAGNLTIVTKRLVVQDAAIVSVSTFGTGKSGNLQITASESVEVIGRASDSYHSNGVFAQTFGSGDAGELRINTGRLLVSNGAQVAVGTRGSGNGGSLLITASESVEVIGTTTDGRASSGLLATVRSNATGNGGDVKIDTKHLLVRDGAVISSSSFGGGTAGNIDITARDTLEANNGTIRTDSTRSTGGAITINAGAIRLFGNSDIRSNVASGADNGGNIVLEAGSLIAFDDSDILAFSRDGSGGNITLNTSAFFGENYRSAPRNTDPATLNNNNRVDVNATGTTASGTIILPDTSFVQNSLTALPESQINTDTLLATSCIVRRNQPTQGRFIITGAGGLPQRPGDAQMSSYATVNVETLLSDSPAAATPSHRLWQTGDPIVEPQGVYRLPDGRLVLSRECP